MDFGAILDEVFNQLNSIRVNPNLYLDSYAKLQRYYNGNLFRQRIKTREGAFALRSLIDQLAIRGGEQSHRLKWSFALHLAADQQAEKLGRLGLITTDDTQHHVTLPQRIKKYALVRGRISQVYQFGGRNAQQVLQCLLVDDGLASRKRRNTLLDPIYKYIGVGSCFHENHGTVTVIIMAQDLISFVSPEPDGKYRIREPFSQGKERTFSVKQQVILDECVNELLPRASNYHNRDSSIKPQQFNQYQYYRQDKSEPQFILDKKGPGPSRFSNTKYQTSQVWQRPIQQSKEQSKQQSKCLIM